MKQILLGIIFMTSLGALRSQSDLDLLDSIGDETKPKKDYVRYTFKTTRVINAHSTETVAKHALDFRVAHRFGNLADWNAGHSFFGLTNATDILIAFEYGISDQLQVGIGRTQGAGPLRELYNGNLKYKLYEQTRNGKHPISITLYGNACLSSMASSNDSTSVSNIQKFAHRTTYMFQGIIARKFSENFSLEILPTYIHRNLVDYYDENELFAVGIAGRIKFSKRVGMVFDCFLPISTWRFQRNANYANYYLPIGVGIEWETGGHVFHINLSNSAGLLENDFIPYSSNDWLKGQFRLGFTISRVFQLF